MREMLCAQRGQGLREAMAQAGLDLLLVAGVVWVSLKNIDLAGGAFEFVSR